MNNSVRLVYFSSVTENTKRFVDKLGFDSQRIPLRPADGFLEVSEPYILFVPTYGGDGNGNGHGAVPKQVIKFLNHEKNRELCLGVVSAGNMNFHDGYGLAGKVISAKLHIPWLYTFELLGTPSDVDKVKKGIEEHWDELMRLRFSDKIEEKSLVIDRC